MHFSNLTQIHLFPWFEEGTPLVVSELDVYWDITNERFLTAVADIIYMQGWPMDVTHALVKDLVGTDEVMFGSANLLAHGPTAIYLWKLVASYEEAAYQKKSRHHITEKEELKKLILRILKQVRVVQRRSGFQNLCLCDFYEHTQLGCCLGWLSKPC